MQVPLHYAPMQKLLGMLEPDPNKDRPTAISLPRMSFEIVNIIYDPERKIGSTQRITSPRTDATDSVSSRFAPAPYSIDFELNIIAKYSEDALKIWEQIAPFFKPDYTVSAELIEGFDPVDIPVILNGISFEDTYDGNFEERRAIIWTLTFTMKTYYFGGNTNKKVIKFANTQVFTPMDANTPFERVIVYPGLDANGNPTTDPNNAIDTANVSIDDNWAYICTIEDVT